MAIILLPVMFSCSSSSSSPKIKVNGVVKDYIPGCFTRYHLPGDYSKSGDWEYPKIIFTDKREFILDCAPFKPVESGSEINIYCSQIIAEGDHIIDYSVEVVKPAPKTLKTP